MAPEIQAGWYRVASWFRSRLAVTMNGPTRLLETELSVCSTARISGAVGRSRPVKYWRDELGSQSKHRMHRDNATGKMTPGSPYPAKSERASGSFLAISMSQL